MAHGPFHHGHVRVFQQATEDPSAVLEAMRLVAGPVEPNVVHMEGQWGQRIEMLDAELSGKMMAARMAHLFREPGVGDQLLDELAERLDDDCTFHARFDKQRAAEGILGLARGDDAIVLEAKVAAYPAKHSVGLDVLRRVAADANDGTT